MGQGDVIPVTLATRRQVMLLQRVESPLVDQDLLGIGLGARLKVEVIHHDDKVTLEILVEIQERRQAILRVLLERRLNQGFLEGSGIKLEGIVALSGLFVNIGAQLGNDTGKVMRSLVIRDSL